MSRALAKIPPNIDPEFAQAYAESASPVASPEVETKAAKESDRDPLLELKAIAERQQREGLNRKQFPDGSFDQVENDLTNVGKICWDFLTRP